MDAAVFWSKYTPEPNSGCWLWTAGASSTGYGVVTIAGRAVGAHRVSWELSCGPIPDGLWVLHRCDTPACVNPDHLFLGTCRDNVVDKVKKARDYNGLIGAEQCRNGHRYGDVGAYVIRRLSVAGTNRTTRKCKECHKARVKKYESGLPGGRRIRRRAVNAV